MHNLSLEFLMNQTVANLQILYTKLHCYHWYIKGEMFIALHGKFEDLYSMITERYDLFAERLLMIGDKPIFTLKEVLSLATLKEALGQETAEVMIKSILDDFMILINDMQYLRDASEAKDDFVSADLAISFSGLLQKEVWILRSLLA